MCEHKVSLNAEKSLTNFTSSLVWKQTIPGVILRTKVQSLAVNDGDRVNLGWYYLRGVLNLKMDLGFLHLTAMLKSKTKNRL